MAKIKTDSFNVRNLDAYRASLSEACRASGAASVSVARFALYLLAAGVTAQEVASRMVDAVADIPGASMGVYTSQMKRIANAGTERVACIVAERDACETWVGFASLIRAYDIPATGSTAGRKTGPKNKGDNPKGEPEEKAASLDTLPELLMAFVAVRNALPKVSASMEAQTLCDQALALLRQEAQRIKAANKAPL